MGNSKNYYMEEKIGNDGIAKTKNPIYKSKHYQPYQISPRNINIGEHFTSDSKYDETLGDVTGAIEEGLTVDDLRARQQSGWEMAGNAIVNNLAIAGTTELGLIDPIEEISKIAHENNIYFHVDATFGGFSIPFLRDMGYDLPVFDFSLEGVCSITIDPHKMGLAPIPAGGIIFRKEEYLDVMAIDSPYLTVKTQSTIVGTRSGAASAATYAIMKYFGKEGYSNLIKELMVNTKFLKENLEKIGYEVICEPELNLVAFNHPEMDTHKLAEELEKLGWKVSVANCPVAIRIVLMNHIKMEHLKELVEDLKEIF